MLTGILERCFILFVLSVCCVTNLTSCSSSITTGHGSTSRQTTLLKDLGNGICRQSPRRLMWQITKSEKFSSLNEANEYVNSLTLGGYDDWRLPTAEEMLFLSELLKENKNACEIKFTRPHWVNTEDECVAGYWADYHLCGGADYRWAQGSEGYVRAVRH